MASPWLSYANYSAIPTGNEHLTAYGTSDISRPVQGQNYRQIRERVTGSWRIRGLDEATARMLVNTFGASYQQNSAFPDVGSFLIVTGSPAAGASSIKVSNLRPSADGTYKILDGWRFQVFGDPTIYTVTADATLPTTTVEETDAQIKAPPALSSVYGADYDETNDKILYVSFTPASNLVDIRKCDGNGANDGSVITKTTLTAGYKVACNPLTEQVYYSYVPTATNAVIRRVDYDGTGDTLIHTSSSTTAFVELEIDFDNGYLYASKAATGVTRMTLAGASAATFYSGALYCMGKKPGAALYVQSDSSKTVYSISEGGTQTEISTLVSAMDHIMHDESDGGFFTGLAAGDDLHKFNASGEELYERPDFFFGSSQESIVVASGLNQFVYTHTSGGVRGIDLFSSAVTLAVTPVLSTSAAIANNAEVYFFLTESCNATRNGEANGPYWLVLRAAYGTRWLNGPATEEVA